jgi:hypothetical protein
LAYLLLLPDCCYLHTAKRHIVHCRVDATKIEAYEAKYPELKEASLLNIETVPAQYAKDWQRASVDRF